MSEQPKYLTVADALRREIAAGVFRDGQALMTEEELRLRFGVSRQTVRQAISLLEDDGLVDRRRGSGTYVRHGPRKRQGLIHVGVMMNYITEYISPAILSGIESTMNENGAIMSLSASSSDSRRERSILERLLDGQVDGLIVEGSQTARETPNRDYYQRLAERNIPVLFMNGFYPGLEKIPHLIMDDYEGGRMAARELLSRGYRQPAGVFKTDDYQGAERARGFLDELKSRGVEPPEENLLFFGTAERMDLFESGRGQALIRRITGRKGIDSVACYNDIFAVSLMKLLQEAGAQLPRDLGVIGFDNADVGAVFRPAMTTLGHPKEAFGALAAEKMLRMIAGEKEESQKMPWKLIERDSLPEVNRK